MKIHPTVAVCLGTLASTLLAQGQVPTQAGRGLKPVAFQDVSVIPMNTEQILPHQTVLVRDGKVAAIGPAPALRIPSGSIVMDGRGKFLLPGPADMHTHVDQKEM